MKSHQILKDYLIRHSSFSNDEIETIASFFKVKQLKKDELLFSKGHRFRFIVFVVEGILRSYIHDQVGEEVVKTFITENQFFAELTSFEKDQTTLFNVSAIESSKVLLLSSSDSNTLSKYIKDWDFSLQKAALESINEAFRREEFLKLGDAPDKYRYFVANFPELARRVPLKHIASYLQITPSSLSRIRREGW